MTSTYKKDFGAHIHVLHIKRYALPAVCCLTLMIRLAADIGRQNFRQTAKMTNSCHCTNSCHYVLSLFCIWQASVVCRQVTANTTAQEVVQKAHCLPDTVSHNRCTPYFVTFQHNLQLICTCSSISKIHGLRQRKTVLFLLLQQSHSSCMWDI